MSVLAIDQGTTSTRAVLFNADGARPLLSRRHRRHHPRPGWVEHDAEELLAHVAEGLAAGHAAGAAAWALANQGETCLAWDAETGRPAGPAIVWQDARTQDATEAMERRGAGALVRARAGLPLDPYFSASKLGWLMREAPEVAALRRAGRLRLGTTDAFFRDRLTGRHETDPATASRTALMALDDLRWDDDLCALFGVPADALPAIRPSAGELGDADGLPLRASLVDQQASLHGHGCDAPGAAKVTFGTGAFALMPTGPDRPTDVGAALPTVAWQRAGEPPLYALEGGVYCAGSAVDVARGLGLFAALSQIEAFDGPMAAARGLAFVPALAGLAAPHWDRRARGAWMGLGLDTTARDMARAVLEGVAFRTAEVLDAMPGVAGPLRIDGGLSANPHFRQLLADVAGRPVLAARDAELTARGAAALAGRTEGIAVAPARFEPAVDPRPLSEGARETFAAAREAVQRFGARGRA